MGYVNQKKFTEQTGMQYHAKSMTYYGNFGGYECFFQTQPNSQVASFIVGAAPTNGWNQSDAEIQVLKETLNQQLTNLKTQFPKGVEYCTFAGFKIIVPIRVGTSDKATQTMVQIMTAVTDILHQNNMINCCTECGIIEVSRQMYNINANPVCCCESCFSKINSALDQHQQEMIEKPENKALGIFGAIGGTIAVFILTFVLLKLGYIAYITGYLGLLCGLLLYKKLAGKLSVIGAVLCVVLCLFGSCFANIYYVGGVIAEFNQDYVSDNATMLEDIASEREAVASLTDEAINELTGGQYQTADEYLAYATSGAYTSIAQYSQTLDESEDYFNKCKENQTAFKAMAEIPDCMDDNAEATGEIVKNLLWGIISIIIGAAVTVPMMLRESKGKYTIDPLF